MTQFQKVTALSAMIFRLLLSAICLLFGLPCMYISKYQGLTRNAEKKKKVFVFLCLLS